MNYASETGAGLARRLPRCSFAALCLLLLVTSRPTRAEDETPFTRLFDTGIASTAPFAEETLASRAGWRLVPEETTNHTFSGDAVMLNDKLAVVFRKAGLGPEAYARTATGWKHRALIMRPQSASPPRPGGLKVVENSSGAVMLETKDSTSDSVRFRLITGEAILEVWCEQSTGFVTVDSNARYVVVPDYFGDDLVYPSSSGHDLALPTENFSLDLIDGGDAIIMKVWPSSKQQAWLAPKKITQPGAFPCSARIQSLRGKSLWLAFLETPGLWRASEGPAKDGWTPPFPAKWRGSLVNESKPARSWDLANKQENGPATGPFIVYPIDRSSATPLTVVCPTDVMRNTLGVGPCQYILACEGLGAQGDPTPNSVMSWVEKQFQQKKDKKAADDIKERLGVMLEHVSAARGRIQLYVQFASQARQHLISQPGSEGSRSILDEMDRFAAIGLSSAASPEKAKHLAAAVEAWIGKPDALKECSALGEQLRAIGAAQDGALARCRMAVRRLIAEARTTEANQQHESSLALELQRLSEQVLQAK